MVRFDDVYRPTHVFESIGALQGGPGIQGGPKKVSHHQFFKKIALKIANEIRFLRKVKV